MIAGTGHYVSEAVRDELATLRAALEGLEGHARLAASMCSAEVEAENQKLRAQLIRTGEAWETLSKLPAAPPNVQGSARIFSDEIRALLKAKP